MHALKLVYKIVAVIIPLFVEGFLNKLFVKKNYPPNEKENKKKLAAHYKEYIKNTIYK